MSETKKLTGIQKPLEVSSALAKIIGTKKGEQVLVYKKKSWSLYLLVLLPLKSELLRFLWN